MSLIHKNRTGGGGGNFYQGQSQHAPTDFQWQGSEKLVASSGHHAVSQEGPWVGKMVIGSIHFPHMVALSYTT